METQKNYITETAFYKFKEELFEKLDTKFDKKFDGFRNWGIFIITIFGLVFGFLFYFVDDRYQEQISRLNSAVYTPTNQAIQKEMDNLKKDISNMNDRHNKKVSNKQREKPRLRKASLTERDPNSISRGLSSVIEQ